jgi:hypothetical protein
MKILLSESQYKSLTHEVQTKEKNKMGSGVWHIVYPSKKYPDKVYKIGSPGIVKSWINTFKENPNIFPNVYHVGNGEYDGKNYMYVLLEKLNTKKLEKLWYLLDDISFEVYRNMDFDEIVIKYTYNHQIDPEYLTPIKKFIKEHYPNIYDQFIEIINLIDMVIKVKQYPDLHMGQFGYDNNGKLKCLDI